MNLTKKIKNYIDAATPCVFVLTHEEARLCLELTGIIQENIHLVTWDIRNGLKQIGTTPEKLTFPVNKNQHNNSTPASSVPTTALDYISECDKQTAFVLKDFHLHLDNPSVIRTLRNAWNSIKNVGSIIIIVGCRFAVPVELQKEVQLLDYSFPDEAAIKERLNYVWQSVNKSRESKQAALEPPISADIEEAIVEAAKGMTFFELENALSFAAISTRRFNSKFVEVVFGEKIAQLKKGGKLTYMNPDIGFDNVGGMSGLKNWIRARKKAYSSEAREYNLPLPKGMLLASVPGTGKSLICKAIAKEFDCPLFALDMGSIFESLVGNTEKNMREVIKTIESIGKCVILIDEIEKSLSSSATSGSGDSGVSSRIFATFLTWLNDRTNPAFIVATTNNHTLLPSALIRKGRFDQLFWVDLPSPQERTEIFEVVIKKYKRDPRNFNIRSFVKASDNYTGAEIEEVFKDALYKAFDKGEEVSDEHIMDVLSEFIPFAHSHEDDLETMREHARGKLVMVNEQGDPVSDASKNLRKLNIAIGIDND